MTELTIIHWNYLDDPKTDRPGEGEFVIVEYQKAFWTGTYTNDLIKLFPDYLGWIYLSDCKRWAAWEQDDA